MTCLKKDFLLLATKLIEKIPDPHNAKEQKHKISQTIINNYLLTKKFCKLRHY